MWPMLRFWHHDVVDTMSIVNSIERTKLSGVVYRDLSVIGFSAVVHALKVGLGTGFSGIANNRYLFSMVV